MGKPVPMPLSVGAPALHPTGEAQAAHALTKGTGQFVHPSSLAKPRVRSDASGEVNFRFEDQPIQAVVQVILGDLLKVPYTMAPGVDGRVTFSTAAPVDQTQAFSVLELLLSWTDNALVRKGDGYMVLPAKQALAGNLVPRLNATSQSGLQVRLFPLRYIAASQMQKLLAPFAKSEALLQVDDQRNLLTLVGTSEELQNYQQAIDSFDVNWLQGMSVAVFNLQHTDVGALQSQLDTLFGLKADTPMAGMVRFVSVEQANTLIAISTQPDYLEEVQDWVERIDRGKDNRAQLYVYDARHIDAEDLAGYLNDIYGESSGASPQKSGAVGPGLAVATLGPGAANGSVGGLGSNAPAFGSAGGTVAPSSPQAAGVAGAGKANATLANGVRITAADAGNQLLVRATPEQWEDMLPAIHRLDAMPMQVQIEMRVLEVSLTGDFQFGVQWYLQGLAGQAADSGQASNPRQIAVGKASATYNPSDTFFYSFVNHRMQVALHAMESSGNTRVLSAPSVIVANKQSAHVQVGSRIPITQNYIDTSGSANATLGNVEYQDTGVILDVTPRVNPGGLVYMTVGQQVSNVDTTAAANANGNPTIQQRQISTHAIVQSGQTVLLGGLIQQNDSQGDARVPLIGRVPLLGHLFGTTSRSHDRTELIVLITPTVIANSDDARRITEEYRRKLKALQPLPAKR
ncbi:type II secretion system secretin GspD [Dyella sp. 2HG41-7]|uniref:type II secretion system secretin GspD n=1 Tax=Dyella sp. 2HG41-7 TaxID=2883239 RepID=UPI001F200408